MSFLYKALKSESYVFNTIPKSEFKQNSSNIPSFFVKHDYFENSLFPSAITEWSKLGCFISNADLFEVFKKRKIFYTKQYPIQCPNSNLYQRVSITFMTLLE